MPLPNEGRAFFERCRAALDRSGREYVVIEGDFEARERAAIAAVEALLDLRAVDK